MARSLFYILGFFLAAASTAVAQVDGPRFTSQQLDTFENEVRPILVKRCFECHGDGSADGGLSLESREEILDGGDTGAAIDLESLESSLLLRVINYDDVIQMPPDSKLSTEEIKILRDWVVQKAPWPQHSANAKRVRKKAFSVESRKAEHWCWQRPEPIKSTAGLSLSGVVDSLVEEKLSREGLAPNDRASRSALLRRASFDLTGLPPSLDLVDNYVINQSVEFEAVVDQLLASPHFGEHWARHWLDLARYAETYGHEFDYPIRSAWQYRDYLIRAFNADVPYDKMIVEHIAGDLLKEAPEETSRFSVRTHPQRKFNESELATGFWFLGEATHGPVDVRDDEIRRIDNQIDVLCRSFLGLTVSCARCHDHKFDAISTKDYYAMAGFLQSSRKGQTRIDEGGRIAKAVNEVQGLLEDSAALMESFAADTAAKEERPVRSGDLEMPVRFEGDVDDKWFARGPAFEFGQDFPVSFVGQPVLDSPGQISSARGGNAFYGSIKSPTFVIGHDRIHIRLKAKDAKVRLVVDSMVMDEFNSLLFKGLLKKSVTHDKFQWLTLGGDLPMYRGHRAWLEIEDKGSGFFVVDRVVASDRRKPPKASGDAGQAEPLENSNDTAVRNRMVALSKSIKEATTGLPRKMAITIEDGSGENEVVFIRGNHKTPGEVAPRQLISGLVGADRWKEFENMSGSGRLLLARQIACSENPLTARVVVNRIWHHLLGRGIVSTVDNFGVLGEAPSHPELLDHLAVSFAENGWSVKGLIRELMMTRTYQRSAAPNELGQEKDPEAKWFYRRRLKRLGGESIRDQMLAVAGTLDSKMFGPSVPIHLTPFMTGRGRPSKSGPLDGNGRRSIYITVRRNFLSPMMLAFDTPIPINAIGRRTNSNVPAQALMLMNDPFVASQAKKFAAHLAASEPETEKRIELLYRTAFARMPTEPEIRLATEFLADGSEHAWESLCHVVFNTKEFIFLQ